MVYNKRKIINDPVHGFITLPNELAFDIIEHPYFQRLRRIRQLGLTCLVYPGANHTRFQHALGSMHLMMQAVEMLRLKEIDISDDEAAGLYLAILLHDVGHGPFSHALEHTIVEGLSHETLSALFMEKLNALFDKNLQTAISIFSDTYPKRFMHQLVSGQMDVDRLDYLMRDSFYTGVSEGVISTDRIIKMMNVFDDQLVVEAKGIYSVEKFIVARRLMYWQVYLHKTVLSAEHLLINILKRAKYLRSHGVEIFTTPALDVFLKRNYTIEDFRNNSGLLDHFAALDDNDILMAAKMWAYSDDKILAVLSEHLIKRNLFRIEIRDFPFEDEYIEIFRKKVRKRYAISEEETAYMIFSGEVTNSAYDPAFDRINIFYRDGRILDITESSEQINADLLSRTVRKFFLCYPKNL